MEPTAPAERLSSTAFRMRQLAVCLVLIALAFHQSPGLIGNDTKLDLTADPARFLRRALDLWNPHAALGQLQNQAYGYLFPMGAYHLLGHWLGMPAWVVQRSWMALLLVVAFLGVVRLAGRLGLGSPEAQLLAGLAYALAPRVLTEIGGNSSETLPIAVLPWVLLPLVGAGAEQRPRTAGMRSGVAVLCMGAVNAAAVLALLPLPALWLVPGLRRRSGRRLALWWSLAVALACTWWFVPLLLQGRYSPNFLNYIETAATTTSTTPVAEVLRGTSHWLAYVGTGHQPWWPAGWTLLTNGGVILDTGVLAVLCGVGLLFSGMPRRGRLTAAVALGLLVMSVGHVGHLDSPVAQRVRDLLDGPLAPFRNVHKFEALVRLPLVLGLCALISLPQAARARRRLAAVVALVLVGSASPAIAGQLVPAGAYSQLPSWWTSTGTWLDEHSGQAHSLVVPASGFGQYLWGRPLDNPLQALTRSSWVVRDAVPLGSAGSTRLLDAVETRLDTGDGSPALAAVLVRSGVRYLVVSNDLDPTRTGAPRPVLVHQALERSGGLHRVASFGPQVGGDPSRRTVSDDGLNVAYPAVEIWEVGTSDLPPVTTFATAGALAVSGGPESLFQLGERGLLNDHATVLAGAPRAAGPVTSVLSDALRRREVDFGSVRDNSSATLTATQPLTRAQPVPDVLPQPGVQHLATARYVGAADVSASSSASDAGTLFHRDPTSRPAAAFDQDPGTSWTTGSLFGPTGQWVQVDLTHPVDPAGTQVRLLRRSGFADITQVTVRTDQGSAVTRLRAVADPQPVNVPPGPTRRLRVTVDRATSSGFGAVAGITDVLVPGVDVQTVIDLPDDQVPVAAPLVVLDRAPGAVQGCVAVPGRSTCSAALARPGEDDGGLSRQFALPFGTLLPLTATAVPVAGPALDSWLAEGTAVRVTASSQQSPDPVERPAAVLDGDPATGWVAAPADVRPTLTLTWPVPRRVDALRVVTSPDLNAARVTRLEVTDGRGSRTVDVPKDGLVRFAPLVTRRLQLRITGVEQRTALEPDGTSRDLPPGISALDVPALVGLRAAPASQLSLPCGQGPVVTVDGVDHPTAARVASADLLQRRPFPLQVCDGAATGLALGSGTHLVHATQRGPLAVAGVTLGRLPATAAGPPRPATVRRWAAEHRLVEVGAGPESYLVVHENANPGWRATLDGTPLRAVQLDGWQQAWVVPAGAGGRVEMTFAPGRSFHRALLGGGVLVLLLLLLAAVPARVRPVEHRSDLRLATPVRLLLAAAVLVLLGGVFGLAALALLGLVALVLPRRWQRHRPALLAGTYAGALLLATVLTALSPWNGPRPPAALGAPVQALALLALAAAGVAVSVPPWSTVASGPEQAARPPEG